MTDRKQKLAIARLVYSDIMEIIERWEGDPLNEIKCCWDECIWVDDEFFGGHELGEFVDD